MDEERAPHPMLRYFQYDHLPVGLAAISKPFADLAYRMDRSLLDGAEKTVTLRKLLESKDAAVRAGLDA